MIVTVEREPTIRPNSGEAFTPGRMYVNGLFIGFTCEDEDRQLEVAGVKAKVYGKTAIGRGTYALEVSRSPSFKRDLPAVLDVPGFTGIRIHGGNRAEDSLGCILLGQVRTASGIAQCAATVNRLINVLTACKGRREECWLEVK